MKIKKYLTALLLSVAGVCTAFAFGCVDDDGNNPPDDGDHGNTPVNYTVTFQAGDNFKYLIDEEEVDSTEKTVASGSSIEFSLVIDEGYTNPVVRANGTALTANGEIYSYTVVSDVTVRASVSVEPEFTLNGEGTSDSPYLIEDLRGLNYVARMVNSGSSTYVPAYYRLENDIDCGGASLSIIGDFTTPYAYFAGNFDGNGKTVSNFIINPGRGYEYVGFFGCVQTNGNTGSGVIQNLNLKDFEVRAVAEEGSNICVGSFVGYLAGANLVACSAVDGVVNANGRTYFSYSGGAVGIQQTVTLNAGMSPVNYLSSIDYVHTDVDIVNTGFIFASGGIVGYAYASNEMASATIVNSYTEGQITGAMRAGGIAGWLGDYGSIANCYSTGFQSASISFDINNEDPDLFAYAGGLVAYAGVGTIMSDSFSTSGTETMVNNTGSAEGEIYAGTAQVASGTDTALTVLNCYSGNAVKATEADFVINSLKWNTVDWVIENGKLPVTNLSAVNANSFKVTLNYGNGYTVGGNGTKDVSISVTSNNYLHFAYYVGDTLGGDVKFNEYVIADNGRTSYAYFFDSSLTEKVPYSYVPTRDITLYVGFADYNQVAGTYYFEGAHGRTIKVELDANGAYRYVDVVSTSGTKYVYDGETIIFKDALFARHSSLINTTQDENGNTVYRPDYNYNAYTFVGKIESGLLKVYDGSYFTETNPLVFTSTAPVANANADFIGVWEKSASLNERYEFKADGSWTYTFKSNTKSGSYTVSQGVATLTGGLTTTATIDASGLLLINGEFFSLKNSYNGVWYSPSTNAYLSLNGYGNVLMGTAVASVDGRVYSGLTYVKDGFFDNRTGNENDTFTILSQFALFGYFEFKNDGKIISAYFFNSDSSEFLEYSFYLLDNFEGEWIGEGEIDGRPFSIANFNGLGIYKNEGGTGSLGLININGQSVRVEYEYAVDESGSYDGNLSYNGVGKFEYNGIKYVLSYNTDGTITISSEDGSKHADMERKDVMYNMPLVDADGTVYRFNGGGNLKTNGGKLTLTTTDGAVTEYGYKIVSGTVDIAESEDEESRLDILIHVLDSAGAKIGTIQVEDVLINGEPAKGYKFEFKLDASSTATKLDLYFAFANKEWAINGYVNLFQMGNFDLSYEAIGSFNGTNDVPFAYYPEYNYILVQYSVPMQGSVRIYLLLLNDGNIAVSSYPYMVSGDYSYASPKDELFGNWINTVNSSYSIEFDGLADCMYSEGVAFDHFHGITFNYTRRFGKIYMWKYDDENVAYTVTRITSPIATGENIFLKENSSVQNRLRLEEFDVLNTPVCVATDTNGTVYNFAFDGSITFGERSGTYLLSSVEGNITTVVVIDGDERITLRVNHATANVTVVED